MKIAVIGAGRLATQIAPALQEAGCEVMEVWSRTQASAEALAVRVIPTCQARWGTMETVTREADLYLVSVSDTALAEVITALHPGREQALMVHTAGSMPLKVFRDAGHERAGVFYPMQTFSKERRVEFTKVHFFVEGTDEVIAAQLQSLAERLTTPEHVHLSTSAMRRQLHLAAVFACNFANHCCTLAEQVLADAGLDFDVMLPLLDETVEKLHQLPPRQAQTGPAVRRDENVMGMQRAMLTAHPTMQQLYTLLSKSIQDYDKL